MQSDKQYKDPYTLAQKDMKNLYDEIKTVSLSKNFIFLFEHEEYNVNLHENDRIIQTHANCCLNWHLGGSV